jgi:hypothetical protein
MNCVTPEIAPALTISEPTPGVPGGVRRRGTATTILHQRPLADEGATYDITSTLFGVGWSGAAVSPNFCSGKVDANGDCV